MCDRSRLAALAEDLVDLGRDFSAAGRPVPDGACVMCEVVRAHPDTKLCGGCEIRLEQMAEQAECERSGLWIPDDVPVTEFWELAGDGRAA